MAQRFTPNPARKAIFPIAKLLTISTPRMHITTDTTSQQRRQEDCKQPKSAQHDNRNQPVGEQKTGKNNPQAKKMRHYVAALLTAWMP
ncbi:hypothetical protein [Shewanella sp. Isolate8]|uniref:hypothetical protein n=1 Tax=Shewanella sp. Isolate8 TaxID=2908529 RepID=UPI001EFCACEE|nr:hypothetical protein [Shewanella sp. Isolate8]MCG9746936.1 hypothetical protein [Shewanella sp. Isolate8]